MKKKATDSIRSQIERDLPVPDWHIKILEERAEELDQLPEEERSRPWGEIKREIWGDDEPGDGEPSVHGMK